MIFSAPHHEPGADSYKVVVKSNQGNAKTTTHDVPAPGSWWGALKIKAVPGARYQLIDNTTGQGPDNIRVKRAGNCAGPRLDLQRPPP